MIELGFIQRSVVSVMKDDMLCKGKKVGLEYLDLKEAELLIKQRVERNTQNFLMKHSIYRHNCKKLLVS